MNTKRTSQPHLIVSSWLPRLSGAHLRLVIAGLLILSAALLASSELAVAHTDASAHSAQPNATAERLTHTLVTLNAQYKQADSAEQAQLLGNLVTLARVRQRLLIRLTEDNTAEVLRLALPTAIRDSLPPTVQAYIEEEEEHTGILEILHEDWPGGGRYRYGLQTASARYSLHFAADQPTHLLTGVRIRARGVRLDTMLALASGGKNVQTVAAAPTSTTFGEQPTLVMLVNFSDNPMQPWSRATVQQAIFGTMDAFISENSYGATWVTGDVTDWMTISLSSSVCDVGKLASLAQQAAQAAGWTPANYSRWMYAFPHNMCGFGGASTIGGSPSQAWLNGNISLRIAGHEFGHGLGLWHSHSVDCGSVAIGPTCTTREYGDVVDVMGTADQAHFNAFQKERLGWLNAEAAPPITTVMTDGTYPLEVYALDGSGPKALRILKSIDPSTGKRTWYYVEFRQAIGFDAVVANPRMLGVLVRTGSESSGDSSYLLDMTPESASYDWGDPALVVGQSFYDPDSGVTIAPASVSSTGASVSVSFASPACVRANPTVALSPSQSQWVSAGTAVTYTVTVANRDNAGCTASSFSLQAAVPSGWTAAFANAALVIGPGASASTTLQVTSPLSILDGFYTIGVTAMNSGAPTYAASTSATYVIDAGLDVTVSTSQPSYSTNQSVSITAQVNGDGSALSGASVAFTITKPNGTVTTGTATTASDGKAVYTFRLKKNDPLGTYQVKANASLNGASGTAGTSFTVR